MATAVSEPWRDQAHYQEGPFVKCHGCKQRCHATHWGNWCYKCNVARIERINAVFEPFRKAIEE